MLVKVTLDDAEREALSPVTKQNGILAKYTEDAGDLKLFMSKDGLHKYLRTWETIPLPAGKAGPMKYAVTFYEVLPPGGSVASVVLADVK